MPNISIRTAAPYDPATLTVPLNPEQRKEIIEYIATKGKQGEKNIPVATELLNDPDAVLLTSYAAMYSRFPKDHKGTLTLNPVKAATEGATQAAKDALNIPGAKDVAGFIQLITTASTWVRIGEFTVGAVLLAVGINHMLGGAPARAATRVGPGAIAAETAKRAPRPKPDAPAPKPETPAPKAPGGRVRDPALNGNRFAEAARAKHGY